MAENLAIPCIRRMKVGWSFGKPTLPEISIAGSEWGFEVAQVAEAYIGPSSALPEGNVGLLLGRT